MKKQSPLIFLMPVILALIILLINFRLVVLDKSYYITQFQKNNVYSNIANPELALDDLFKFLKEGKESSSDILREEEKEHLKDVKKLIERVFYLLYLLISSFLILLAILIKIADKNLIQRLGFILVISSSITFLISLFFFLSSFSNLFTNFHLIFFPQGNWIFPENYLLIKLFPETFFYNITYRIIRNSLILAGLLFALGIYFCTRKRV